MGLEGGLEAGGLGVDVEDSPVVELPEPPEPPDGLPMGLPNASSEGSSASSSDGAVVMTGWGAVGVGLSAGVSGRKGSRSSTHSCQHAPRGITIISELPRGLCLVVIPEQQ